MRRELALLVLSTTLATPLAALAADSSQVPKHEKRQQRPVKLGTSGGNVEDLTSNGPTVCCGGTLGALLKKKDRYFVLSNNHVLARTNQGVEGDGVVQPGLNNTKCRAQEKNLIGTLSGFKRLKINGRNKSDAAIAETNPDNVSPDGALLGIGVPGNEIVKPRVGLEVQKSGRTTGVTEGMITGVNISGTVQFPEECSLDAPILDIRFTKVFIVQSNSGDPFSDSGDSGSMIYEHTPTCPRAVGLLFGGNEVITAGNPAKLVLKDVKKMNPKGKAELVGCDPVEATGLGIATKREAAAERFAKNVQARVEESILSMPGVVAMGIGRHSSDAGQIVFKVYVEDERPELARALPTQLDGIVVEQVVSGPLVAFSCPNADGEPAGGLDLSALR